MGLRALRPLDPTALPFLPSMASIRTAPGLFMALTTIDPATTNELSLDMVDSPDPVPAGNILSYTLSITNYGPIPATGVIVQDALPAGINLVATKYSQGSCSNLGNTIICNLGDLAAG